MNVRIGHQILIKQLLHAFTEILWCIFEVFEDILIYLDL